MAEYRFMFIFTSIAKIYNWPKLKEGGIASRTMFIYTIITTYYNLQKIKEDGIAIPTIHNCDYDRKRGKNGETGEFD